MTYKSAKAILTSLGYERDDSRECLYKKLMYSSDMADYIKYPETCVEYNIIVFLTDYDRYDVIEEDDDTRVIVLDIGIRNTCNYEDCYNGIDIIHHCYNELKELDVFEFAEEFEEMMERDKVCGCNDSQRANA